MHNNNRNTSAQEQRKKNICAMLQLRIQFKVFVDAGDVTHDGLPVWSFHRNHVIDFLWEREKKDPLFNSAFSCLCVGGGRYAARILDGPTVNMPSGSKEKKKNSTAWQPRRSYNWEKNRTYQNRLDAYTFSCFESQGEVSSLKEETVLSFRVA